jgi:hypothetical protein
MTVEKHSTKKKLTYIQLVNVRQVAFGVRLGLDLTGCTLRMAEARIEDCVDLEFGSVKLHGSTSKQISLAAKFGYDITGSSRRVAYAVIGDLMEQLDHETIIAKVWHPVLLSRTFTISYRSLMLFLRFNQTCLFISKVAMATKLTHGVYDE